jgi:antitoxin (DNA-binding transcriptional repressor) of toxin-antitoxin stability system
VALGVELRSASRELPLLQRREAVGEFAMVTNAELRRLNVPVPAGSPVELNAAGTRRGRVDHGDGPWSDLAMETIPVSKFKATCLAVLQRVKRTGRPVRVTRFGKAVADVVPPRASESRGSWLGCMAGTAEIVGDVVSPAAAASEWKALGR